MPQPKKDNNVLVEEKIATPTSDLIVKKQESSENVQNEGKPWKMEFTLNEKGTQFILLDYIN